MPRYINLDELLTAIDQRNGRLPLWLDEILMEDCKVADVVEVVRCKDCIFNENGSCIHSENYDIDNYHPDWYCADGIRKEACSNEN